MRPSPREFRDGDTRRITLIGMAGVGKTRLATVLRRSDWFHYSVDYRIGTRYLDEPILDHIKQQAMQVPFLRDLLRADAIHIKNNIRVDDLRPVLSFLGMLGDPEAGGLTLDEFRRRQRLYRDGLVAAVRDLPDFIRKSREIYGYRHFVNDAAGSVCDLGDPGLIELIARHTVIVYIRATEHDERVLLERAKADPRPLLYEEGLLERWIAEYLARRRLDYVALIDPDDFAAWVFPRLLETRRPRYEAIAAEHGYTVRSDEVSRVTTEREFLRLLDKALERGA